MLLDLPCPLGGLGSEMLLRASYLPFWTSWRGVFAVEGFFFPPSPVQNAGAHWSKRFNQKQFLFGAGAVLDSLPGPAGKQHGRLACRPSPTCHVLGKSYLSPFFHCLPYPVTLQLQPLIFLLSR